MGPFGLVAAAIIWDCVRAPCASPDRKTCPRQPRPQPQDRSRQRWNISRKTSMRVVQRRLGSSGSFGDLEGQGALTAWDPTQRKWFLSFLLPFSQMQGSASRLSAIGRDSAAIDTAPVLDELLGPHFSDPSSLAREIDGFVHLYSQLVNETPTLTDDDARRALRLANAVRSRSLGGGTRTVNLQGHRPPARPQLQPQLASGSIVVSGSTHILDALCATYELASRAESRLAAWRKGHSRTAPRAADSLAQLGASIAGKVKTDAQLAAASLPAVDLARVRSLNGRTSAVVELGDGSRIIRPTIQRIRSCHQRFRRCCTTSLLQGRVLVIGTREMSYELSTLVRDSFDPIASHEVCDAIEWPIFIFSVPHPPLDWSLHHAVLFHEIGHALFPRAPLATIQIPVPAEFDPNATMDLAVRAQNGSGISRAFRSGSSPGRRNSSLMRSDALSAAQPFCTPSAGSSEAPDAFDESSPSHPPTALRAHLGGSILAARGLLAGGNRGIHPR